MPEMTMKLTMKTRDPPMTGLGIMLKMADSFGRKARPMKMPPVKNATMRLVAPVATESPTLAA